MHPNALTGRAAGSSQVRRIRTPFLASALVAFVVGLAGVVAPTAAHAAAAGTATFGGAGESASFTGTAGKRQVQYTCADVADAECTTYTVTVTAPVVLTAVLSSVDDPPADFDLNLYAAGTGAAAATSGHPNTAERIDAVVHPGTYTLQVQPYTATADMAYSLDLTTSAISPEGTLAAAPSGDPTSATFTGTDRSTAPADGCQGDADADCHLYAITVPYAGARLDVAESAGNGDYRTTVYTGRHVELGSSFSFDPAGGAYSLNLPGAGTYYLEVETTVAPPADSFAVDITVTEMPTPDGSGVDPQPGPQPADAGIFTKTVGFATKTGYRGVFSWQASKEVAAVVHYGLSPTALTSTAVATGVPDAAGIVIVDDLEVGKIYYWQVEDTTTGERSVVKSLASTNAYTDWNGSSYTIDLLVQLDSNSLPQDIPADQAVEDIAQGFNIFSERVYDATDGLVRIGQVLVTDTNIDYAANIPSEPSPVCAGNNLADVLVTTSVPFDSHTFGGFSIEDPCTQFYVGRIGQLVVPWEDDLHFGHVASHELSHYAFNAPDLYPQDAGVVDSGGCRNLAWDGSLMHNTGGWTGARWEMTELDRNPTLTPCDHTESGTEQPYTWDAMRVRYLNVPLRPTGPIEHVIDVRARGNEDGGAYQSFILDRTPAASTLSAFVPNDDAGPECAAGAGSAAFQDPAGDVALAGLPVGSQIEPALDVVAGAVGYDATADSLTADIEVAGDPDTVQGSFGNRYRVSLNVGNRTVSLYATRATTEFASTETDVRRFEAYNGSETFPPATTVPIEGAFDSTTNTVHLRLSAANLAALYAQIPATDTAPRPALGTHAAVVGSIAVETGYDNYTGTAGGDTAGTGCSFATNADDVTPVVPELPVGPALPIAAVALMGAGAIVLRRRRSDGA
jgi:hypothetical protein